jgi:hypothetical protein
VRRQRAAAGTPPGNIDLAQIGILLLRLCVALGDRLLERFEAQLQLLSGRRSDLAPKCIRVNFSSR